MLLSQDYPATQGGSVPTIVFGAFDRHNFGDLLFAHMAAALLPNEELLFAGLLQRDMRAYGGHFVHGVRELAARMQHRPVRILHAGGELLTCSAWEAAVMLLSRSEAGKHIADLGQDAQAQQAWAHAFLGTGDLAPYILGDEWFPGAAVACNAVGGADLALRDAALRNEIFHKLSRAKLVTVRDRYSLAVLHAAGIDARLLPDPVVMVADLFAETIDQHARHGEMKQVCTVMPDGYLSVQCSADFNQPAYLKSMAAQLERIAARHRCGIVLFRAGAAPWHDDLECYRQFATHLRGVPVHIFHSLNIWDICALIAQSRAYCGSSLHGRILALAFGRPRLSLRHPDQPPTLVTKQEAFVQTWEDPIIPGVVGIGELEEALHAALASSDAFLHEKAEQITNVYRQGFKILHRRLMAID